MLDCSHTKQRFQTELSVLGGSLGGLKKNGCGKISWNINLLRKAVVELLLTSAWSESFMNLRAPSWSWATLGPPPLVCSTLLKYDFLSYTRLLLRLICPGRKRRPGESWPVSAVGAGGRWRTRSTVQFCLWLDVGAAVRSCQVVIVFNCNNGFVLSAQTEYKATKIHLRALKQQAN